MRRFSSQLAALGLVTRPAANEWWVVLVVDHGTDGAI